MLEPTLLRPCPHACDVHVVSACGSGPGELCCALCYVLIFRLSVALHNFVFGCTLYCSGFDLH